MRLPPIDTYYIGSNPTSTLARQRLANVLRGHFLLLEKEVGSLPEQGEAVLVWVATLSEQEADIISLLARSSDGGTVVLAPSDPGMLRHLAKITVHDVVFETELGTGRLMTALEGACQAAWTAKIERLLTQIGLPPVAAVALRTLVLRADRGRSYRSVDELSRTVGCSMSYLSHVFGRNGLQLRTVMRHCLLLSALRLYEREGNWERVALRLGYRSTSGLSEAFQRTLGTRPSQLDTSAAIHSTRAEIAALLLILLSDPNG